MDALKAASVAWSSDLPTGFFHNWMLMNYTGHGSSASSSPERRCLPRAGCEMGMEPRFHPILLCDHSKVFEVLQNSVPCLYNEKAGQDNLLGSFPF